ncbi:MAG: hypothetical protein HYU66_17355 [Armatimonadetes bacterium]|nr:hypothetical protein [Armatimonadota bacterium]
MARSGRPSVAATLCKCPQRGLFAVLFVVLLLLAGAPALAAGSLLEVNGYRVLSVSGPPDELGRQHGRLLRDEVRRVVQEVIVDGEGAWGLERLLDGARVMEPHLPPEYRAELHALADAAEVDYLHLVALQLFGDVSRASSGYCTGFAAFGPATVNGECIIGRNMDYWDHGASRHAAILLHVKPDRGHEFLTCSWAGIINGWTSLNARGVFCSNNSGYGRHESLEGVSTCFMVRKVAQYAGSVAEGVRLVETTPRAVGTILVIAGGTPPDAAVVEYDHEQVAVRRAKDGWIAADNTFHALGREAPEEPLEGSRAGNLGALIREHYGRIDRSHNFAAAQGVPIRSINLHSALVFPADLSMYVSMGTVPAADQPYHGFRMTRDGVVGLDLRPGGDPPR